MINKYEKQTRERYSKAGYIRVTEYIPNTPEARKKLKQAAERICKNNGMDIKAFRIKHLGRGKS